MDKNTKRLRYNQDVLTWVSEKHNVSKSLCRKALSGLRTSETSLAIVEDYKAKCKELKKVLS